VKWHPDLSSDEDLLNLLSEVLDTLDPVPAPALEVAIAAADICQAEHELAALVDDSTDREALVIFRDEADSMVLTFRAARLTVEIEIDTERRAVGLISPPQSTIIEMETASAQAIPVDGTARSDELGRFRIGVGVGLCRLRIGPGPDAVVTSWFYC
jgi:hypothetical protein